MSISFVDRNKMLNREIRELAERRLLFALTRFDSRIAKVELVITDENGPRGGVDKVCRITVRLLRAGDVSITDRDADLARCISRIAERAGRAVSRSIERSQQFDRSRPSVLES